MRRVAASIVLVIALQTACAACPELEPVETADCPYILDNVEGIPRCESGSKRGDVCRGNTDPRLGQVCGGTDIKNCPVIEDVWYPDGPVILFNVSVRRFVEALLLCSTTTSCSIPSQVLPM